MPEAIIYLSQTGSSKHYAELLSEALGIPAYPLDEAPKAEGRVIFIGWALQQRTMGLARAKRKYRLAAVIQVGMSPVFPDSNEKGRKLNKIPDDCAFFQVQGGYDEEKLGRIYKKSMRTAGKGIVKRIDELSRERELSAQEKAMREMFVNGKGEPASWDISEIVSYFEKA